MPDWLEGFLPPEVDWDTALHAFSALDNGENLPWAMEEHKRSGRSLARRGHVSILDVAERGAYVTITGQGCRELEGDGVVAGWREFARYLVQVLRFRATRFDWAWDDRAGVLPFAEVRDRLESAAVNWQDRTFTTRATVAGGQWSGGADRPYGYTLGVGVRGSETYLRIYDKAVQMRSKGEDVQGIWNRVELEWRRERAEAAFCAVAGFRMPTVGELVAGQSEPVELDALPAELLAGVLRAHIEFKQPGTATRLERCRIAGWWEEFLGFCERARLVVKPVVRSVEKAVEWVQTQVAPALAMISCAAGYGLESIVEITLSATRRLRKSHRDQLQRHQNNFARGLASVAPMFGPDDLDEARRYRQALVARLEAVGGGGPDPIQQRATSPTFQAWDWTPDGSVPGVHLPAWAG